MADKLLYIPPPTVDTVSCSLVYMYSMKIIFSLVYISIVCQERNSGLTDQFLICIPAVKINVILIHHYKPLVTITMVTSLSS